jgi:2Fe-2S ferredoxin
MITLTGRSITKQVETETGLTLLDHALKHDVDWAFSCTRGTCARCRCLVTEGQQQLNEPTDAELVRLEPSELAEGYRLGCQAEPLQAGDISAKNAPYF